jgi:hypothetical protein
MNRYHILAILLLLVLSCSGEKEEADALVSSQYTLLVEKTSDFDKSLVEQFNSAYAGSGIPRVERFYSALTFPQILPDVMVFAHQFESGKSFEAVSICYDSVQGRYYALMDRFFEQDFNDLIADRFENINEDQAFLLAAVFVYLNYHPRMIVCRSADLFLESRLRRYMNDSFVPEPRIYQKEFSNDWWAWTAFPSANNEYRKFHDSFADSLKDAKFLRDIPDGTFGVPSVSKKGIYYEVIIYGLPKLTEDSNEINRYKLRIASNGRLHDESVETVYYY